MDEEGLMAQESREGAQSRRIRTARLVDRIGPIGQYALDVGCWGLAVIGEPTGRTAC